MKNFILLCVLFISLVSCTLQGMSNCQLCTLTAEYKETHQAMYAPIECLFCKQEVDSNGLSYELLTLSDYTFRIHDAQELNCLELMKNSFTHKATPLCNECTNILNTLKTEEPFPDDYEPIGRCHACAIICCPWLLLSYWDKCTCSDCPGLYCHACTLACCPRK